MIAALAVLALTACTDETSSEPVPTTVDVVVGGAVETTAPPTTAAPTTATPTTEPPPTTVAVPEGPEVAPGALRVTLGDTYVDGETILSAGAMTFDIWNGGADTHALRVVDADTEVVLLESRPLAAQEWEILDVDLDPGVYRFESDAATLEVSVTG